MKKAIGLVFVIAMTAVLMMGCGGASDKNNKSITQTTTQTAAENKKAAADVNNDGYIIMVTDPDAAPVKGALVQFCSDSMCMMGKTDDTGCAVFKVEPGKYTVHILKAEGYVVPKEEEFAVPEEYGVVNITLQKK